MSVSLTDNELKKRILKLLREDKEFRKNITEILSETLVSKAEIKSILEEIKNLRIDFNNRMEEMREDFNKRMEQFERRMEAFERRMEEMREDFNKTLEAFDLKISSLGARWGIYSEAAIRRAFKGILERFFGAKVDKWEFYDEKGVVYGRPSIVEVDIVIRDGEHILVEVKSHVRKSDVTELLRISELYEEKMGVKPKLAIVTPFIENKALEFAKSLGIDVFTVEDLYEHI